MPNDDLDLRLVTVDLLGRSLGHARSELMAEIDAKIGLVLALLGKAAIIDRKMLVETLQEHAEAYDDSYVRGRLKEMLELGSSGRCPSP